MLVDNSLIGDHAHITPCIAYSSDSRIILSFDCELVKLHPVSAPIRLQQPVRSRSAVKCFDHISTNWSTVLATTQDYYALLALGTPMSLLRVLNRCNANP